MGGHEDARWGKGRSRHPIPSLSMVNRRAWRQLRKECCSVYAPTTILPTSMILACVFAIGLSDYSRPVMLARTIDLLAGRQPPDRHTA